KQTHTAQYHNAIDGSTATAQTHTHPTRRSPALPRRETPIRIEPVARLAVRKRRDLRAEQPDHHRQMLRRQQPRRLRETARRARLDRKSTRLNSSHVKISYAVLCLKKKKIQIRRR